MSIDRLRRTRIDFNNMEKISRDYVQALPLDQFARNGIVVDRFNYDYITGYPLGMYVPTNGSALDVFKPDPSDVVFTDLPAAYIHIPFCSGYCSFCYFTKTRLGKGALEDRVTEYLSHLSREIAIWQGLHQIGRFHSLYIGGGTASIMTEKNIQYLFDEIVSKRLHSGLAGEITFEGYPRDFLPSKLKLLKDLGVNRISVGTQSFHDAILKATNRRHDSQDTLRSIENIAHVYDNYNLDLMYGFPGQTVEDVLQDIETAVENGVPTLTFYRLEIHDDTPIWKVAKDQFPSAGEILVMKRAIAQAMADHGYLQDNIDWFIKDEKFTFVQQHHKWSNNYYVGFGMGSYGFFNNVTYSNADGFAEYYSSIRENRLPVYKHYRLDRDELMRREIVFAMKISEGLDLNRFKHRYGVSATDYFTQEIEALSSFDLINLTPANLSLTEQGQLFSDQIAEFFYSDAVKQRVNAHRSNISLEAISELEDTHGKRD